MPKKIEFVFADEIKTIVVEGGSVNTGPEILRIIPLTSKPRKVGKKVVSDMFGSVELVFTKRTAKAFREHLDKWLKEMGEK